MAENGYIALFDMEDGFTPQQVRKLNWNLRRLQRAGDTIVREIGSGGSGGSVVSISQVLHSGTKIATVVIDGVSTDIYCETDTDTWLTATGSDVVSKLGNTPVARATADASGNDIQTTYATKGEIPSVPSPSDDDPEMDGTADPGTSSEYSRSDHVHPVDTSRAASSHSHASSDLPVGTTSDDVAAGDHTHTASDVGALPSTTHIPPDMVILSYGHSTWADFLAAYNTNTVVYCRASSNSNPATGAQTRMAFMAYVNADPPTNVEFQYYRSVATHTITQMGDQVYIYKLTNTGAWTVTVREASPRIVAGDNIDLAYTTNKVTLSLGSAVGTRVTHDQSTAVSLTSGTWGEICNVSLDAGTWIVHGNVQHASNATGRRGACLSTDASAPTTGDLRQRGLQVPPVNGAATMLNTCITIKLTATTVVRLYGLQTSGAANNATGCITAVRII